MIFEVDRHGPRRDGIRFWIGEDALLYQQWRDQDPDVEEDQMEKPVYTTWIEKEEADSLVIAWLQGPMGPVGPIGAPGMAGRDA